VDDRFPALAGPYLVHCSPSGRVDRSRLLPSGTDGALPGPAESPGVGPGLLFATGATPGTWFLDGRDAGAVTRVPRAPTGPPATDGTWAGALFPDHVGRFKLTDTSRVHIPAQPAPGMVAALAGAPGERPAMAWLERTAAGDTDIYWIPADAELPRLLAGGPGDQGPVVGSGSYLHWVTAGAVVSLGPAGLRSRAADTGFLSAPAAWHDEVCWEDRAALKAGRGHVEVRCTDGTVVADERADVTHPSLGPGYLLVRQGDTAYVLPRGKPR
jgi:hypothetical protein